MLKLLTFNSAECKNIFEARNVIVKLITPCIIFKRLYFKSDILFDFITDETWHIIDKPENEHKKLINDNFIFILIFRDEIILQPFVISMEPKKTEYSEFDGKLKKDSMLLKIMLM